MLKVYTMHRASPYNRRLVSIFFIVLASVIIIPQFPAAFAGACADEDEDGHCYPEDDCDDHDDTVWRGHSCDPSITAIYGVMDDVEDLADAGSINQGQATSLLAKLNSAIDKIEADKINTAISLLNAFINQINALIKAGIIDPKDRGDLITSVLGIINDLKMG